MYQKLIDNGTEGHAIRVLLVDALERAKLVLLRYDRDQKPHLNGIN